VPDRIQHAISPKSEIAIPYPDDCEAAPREIRVANLVACAAGMLATIQFHNQSPFVASEVRKIPPDRHLPAKLEVGQSTIF
jgi:hypothetical protein